MRPPRVRAMPALGEEFRSAREARGLSVSDVAEQIHIRSVYLAAIENEEWTSIGAPVYVRGFIRTYARFLALDGEAAVARFNDAVPAARPSSHAAPAANAARERPGSSPWVLLGALVALVLVGYVIYEYVTLKQPGARPVAVQPSSVPGGSQSPVPVGGAAPTQAPTSPPTPAPRHHIAVRLVQRSWLRIAVDGQTKLEGLYPAGTSKSFTGKVADLRVGNAGGVTVSVNGSAAKPLGKAGDVVEQRYSL
jgi:cytoskeleton protein RodZ